MITSSHNPFNWNGVKYKASYGGSGTPAIMRAIEGALDAPRLERKRRQRDGCRFQDARTSRPSRISSI